MDLGNSTSTAPVTDRQGQTIGHSVSPIACSIEDAPFVVGVSRTRIYEAVRNHEIVARKAGRSTIIEIEELKRWLRSLPIKGKTPAMAA